MKRNLLLILPFLAGLILICYSWYLTYPLSTISANDFLFNHISILYWLSLPLLLVPMFLIAVTTKNNLLKWILSIGIVLTFFSLAYFYSMMPTMDSQFYRGMMEYFIKTKSLDPSQFNHNYYQWPAFYVLADIVTSVSGLTIVNFEFLMYTIIGFLMATALYVYGSKKFTNGGVLAVVVFFIPISDIINYQAVPFSLALSLLFLLFMLGTHRKSSGLVVIILLLYSSLLITHFFVPLFFVLYLLGLCLFDKNSQNKSLYRNLFLITLIGWFLVQLTQAKFSFDQIVKNIIKPPVDSYSIVVSNTFKSVLPSNTIYVTGQFFSRTVIIAFAGLCAAGFILLLIKRKTSALDKAILFTGVVYSSLGVVLNTLGYRAVAVAFFPVSLGAAFLFQGKFKQYLVGLFSVLLVLALFVPLHSSFNTEISWQTRESHTADNFFLDHYSWEKSSFVVTDFLTDTYLTAKLSVYEYIFPQLNIGDKPDAILYTPQFAGLNLGNYSSMESLSQGEKLNLLYNDGISCVLIKSQ